MMTERQLIVNTVSQTVSTMSVSQAASMTQIPQRFPDVLWVRMIVTLTHTIVKLPLGQLC